MLFLVFDVLVYHFYLFFHKFDVCFQLFHLAVNFCQQTVSLLGRSGQKAEIVFICLKIVLHIVEGAYQFLAFPVKGLWTTFLNGADSRLEVT